MNWNQYLELSEKTLSSEFHIDKKSEVILHSVMGILTELDELLENYDKELDTINVVEEIGDVLFYLAILGREWGIDFPHLQVKEKAQDPKEIILNLIKNSCKLLDILKKKIYYNKPINEEIFVSLTKIIILNVADYMNYYDIDMEKSFEININKLKARYGDKFSSDSAINRNLELEREILEGKK
jgi:NTP pyrophosphatase (non-canonical NTP hydrolase)